MRALQFGVLEEKTLGSRAVEAMLSHLSLSLICVLGLLNTHTQGVEHDTRLVTSGPLVHPHLIGCRSSELATFRCWWSSGTFSNLSEPGALSLFFQMKTITPSEWQECPEYTHFTQNECYFSREFTQIWKTYCVQLRSATLKHNITYDQQCFTVENIVYPDPPVGPELDAAEHQSFRVEL
ncbi:hypothetical protein Q7C36_012127 [Tachysurus vachellii]|uniref:Growth hormone/erythropoietin receptor ligand binding domain-containing protein n=1 Tax=Tachysurus vachellii TaxID=175792 RepID=A0AA88MM37_TACVA|nr:hypothetical protein Q7C36_012127 [Tachysurus vachellii]